jgi:hypothetical protein
LWSSGLVRFARYLWMEGWMGGEVGNVEGGRCLI